MDLHRWKRIAMVLPFALALWLAGAALYRHHRAAAPPLFCADCSWRSTVIEKGTLRYASGTVWELRNRYLIAQRIRHSDGVLRVTGRLEEEALDTRLAGLLTGDRFDRSFVLDPLDDRCPAAISPLYPMALRRFLYLLPAEAVFPGKVWQARFCDGRLVCRYEAEAVTPEGFSFVADCSGAPEKADTVALAARLFFRVAPGLIERAEGTIRAVQGPVEARWEFTEEPRDGEEPEPR